MPVGHHEAQRPSRSCAGAGSISRIYRSNGVPAKAPQQAPGNLAATWHIISGFTFSWASPTDDHTPAAGLTYNLRVGTTPGGDQVPAAMAAAGGYHYTLEAGEFRSTRRMAFVR